jgi:phosphoribosylformimino-5-aminoimidazole carboxamide ribotide isomerase
MAPFTVYPAIDLREGKVVRLSQGDPARKTVYGDDPAEIARQWLSAGARWLHVVNLDGAFGERDKANQKALRAVLQVAAEFGSEARVQFGGGLRSLDDIARALSLDVGRAILGTAAIETPELVGEAVGRFGADRVAVGIDARDNRVRVRGWVEETQIDPVSLGKELYDHGLRTVVFTNIARDGIGTGMDLASTRRLADATGLDVIASGGVASLNDVARVRTAGLSGVIIGRALYEGQIDLKEALEC